MTCYCPLCDRRWNPTKLTEAEATGIHDELMHDSRPTSVVVDGVDAWGES